MAGAPQLIMSVRLVAPHDGVVAPSMLPLAPRPTLMNTPRPRLQQAPLPVPARLAVYSAAPLAARLASWTLERPWALLGGSPRQLDPRMDRRPLSLTAAHARTAHSGCACPVASR